ncbi:hypothetical protein K0M31_013690 [Melipona bicolor]|uniref:Uncharacterized protein n=1 Tax=Melipona bicolor TaxID=60889 RepID=A0AA40FHI9_9HYME|nr:hypothetical protein K0M31_013690 [Melipona bicolor]
MRYTRPLRGEIIGAPAPLRRPREEISTERKPKNEAITCNFSNSQETQQKADKQNDARNQNFPWKKWLAVLKFQAEILLSCRAISFSRLGKEDGGPVDSKVTRITGDGAAGGSRGQKQAGRSTMEERKTG